MRLVNSGHVKYAVSFRYALHHILPKASRDFIFLCDNANKYATHCIHAASLSNHARSPGSRPNYVSRTSGGLGEGLTEGPCVP